MVCYCGSCYNYLSNILPNVYGKKLPFKLISLYEWLLERYENGELKVKNPLNYKVAVSESCYVSELGDEFQSNLRKIYAIAGADLVELKHHGNENLSCGVACATARPEKLIRSILKGQRMKYKELKEAGIKRGILNCPGCFIALSLTKMTHLRHKWQYGIDDLLLAFGDKMKKPLKKRMGFLVRAAFLKLFKAFKKMEYPMPTIPIEGPVPKNWKELSKWKG